MNDEYSKQKDKYCKSKPSSIEILQLLGPFSVLGGGNLKRLPQKDGDGNTFNPVKC